MTRRKQPILLYAIAAVVVVAAIAAGVFFLLPSVFGPSAGAIAVVNGREIMRADVDKQIEVLKTSSPQSFVGTAGAEVVKQYEAQILSQLIDLELMKEAASSLGVSVAPAEVDAYIARLETQYGGAAALDAASKSSGLTRDTLREKIANRLLQDAVTAQVTTGAVNVTDTQIRTYYDANTTLYATPAQVRAAQILFAPDDKSTATTVLGKVKNGDDFAELAKKYSTDPNSAAGGGVLSWAEPSKYETGMAQALVAMKADDVRLVETQYGWKIIKLLERRAAARQTLAEATPQIRQMLESTSRSTMFATYMKDLYAKATIKVLDRDLEAILIKSKKINAPAGSTTATSTETTPAK
jgi:parvulin-like peptidyl-prolyl isomerase